MHLHAAQVERADAVADTLIVDDRGEELPGFVLGDLAFRFVAPHLLIERVQQLLARGGAGECGAVVKRAAKAAKIQQPFRGTVERNAHAVEQVDDAGRGLAHGFHRGLVGQEVAAVHGVVEVLPGGVAFTLQVLGGIDAALRAHRVRPLDRDDREEVNVTSHLGDLDGGCQSRQPAAHNNNFRMCHKKS